MTSDQRMASAYRRDIDGLRAVAVLSVLFFHAGYPVFSGGYVGVDIFFVISGFLITRIIADGIDGGSFSLGLFYRRRIRRLLPAYAVVLLVVTLVGLFISLPQELVDLGQSLVASSVFATNVLFWQEHGYFASASEIKPLLHTWSLSVEEQFYLFFPALLLMIAKIMPRARMWVIAAIFLFSLAASELAIDRFQTASFYLLPTRAWELMLGSVLALAVSRVPVSAFVSRVMGVVGALMVIAAVSMMQPSTRFPGLIALLPCIGAAAIIWSGQVAGPVRSMLSMSWLVFVGQISYSLYLWHWPVFAYARYYNIDEFGQVEIAMALTLSFVLAWLSWRFVEQPVRDAARTPRFRPFVAVAATSTILFVCGFAFIKTDGLEGRFDEQVNELVKAGAAPSDDGCIATDSRWISPEAACVRPEGARHPSIALWGDSHAQTFIANVADLARRSGRSASIYVFTGCPPVPGVGRTGVAGGSGRCAEWNSAVMSRLLADDEVRIVVLVARHSVYVKGHTDAYGPAETQGHAETRLLPIDAVPEASESLMDGYFARLDAAVSQLTSSGKKVVIVYPIPEVGYDVPVTLALLAARGQSPDSFTTPVSMYVERQGDIRRHLDVIVAKYGAGVIDPYGPLCTSSFCRVFIDGQVLYFDDDHLSPMGMSLLDGQIRTALEERDDASQRGLSR